VWSGLHTA